MIVFDLACRPGGHRFEGWFSSSDDFARQQERGLVACPHCGEADVIKAPMAPAVPRKGNQVPLRAPSAAAAAPPPAPANAPAIAPAMPPEVRAALVAMAAAQAQALKSSRWVGSRFAEDARAMHYGEADVAAIHGQATPEEARDLLEEGIDIAPLLIPVAPPGEVN